MRERDGAAAKAGCWRLAGYARALLYNGLGRYEAATRRRSAASEDDDQGYAGWALVELVEAAARARPTASVAAERALGGSASARAAAGTDWALGVEARSRALLGDGGDAEALYREAIERLGRTRLRVELARAQLFYGEWLRREHRRADAREQLRAAHDNVRALRGGGLRRARPPRAGGHRRDGAPATASRPRDELTPQEAQIARLAGDGQTNPEIGAQLFISPRTVEWHLRKVFTKLGVSSRKELRAALPGACSLTAR